MELLYLVLGRLAVQALPDGVGLAARGVRVDDVLARRGQARVKHGRYGHQHQILGGVDTWIPPGTRTNDQKSDRWHRSDGHAPRAKSASKSA